VTSKKVYAPVNKTISVTAIEKTKDPVEYLGAGWFPINTDFAKNISNKLKNGEFKDNRRNLVAQLKNDLALLTYLLKTIQGDQEFTDNPLKVLDIAPLEIIKSAIDEAVEKGSIHAVSNTLKPQALRIKQSIISCSATELMAKKKGLDGDMAYSVALIRQLGLSLVAWNYPRIYAKALTQITSGTEDLETLLFKGLGFSPRQLGVNLTIANPSADLKVALGFDDPVNDTPGAKLRQISELAEKFAQANDPEHFPWITRQWGDIQNNITSVLGADGLPIIMDRFKDFIEAYGTMPSIGFEQELSKERNLEIANKKHIENLVSFNQYAQKLNNDLQHRIKRVYKFMKTNEVSPEALQVLIVDFVPASGFLNGCVFLQDLETQKLVPKLRIGQRPLDDYKRILVGSSNDNPIMESLHSSVPLKRDGSVLFGERISMVAGLMGSVEKPGVLYLEMNEELASAGGFEPVLRFKAIRTCLNQCLNLKNSSF
jgi:hypothetical protein